MSAFLLANIVCLLLHFGDGRLQPGPGCLDRVEHVRGQHLPALTPEPLRKIYALLSST